jgi:predicted O-methyltransferase YrrM
VVIVSPSVAVLGRGAPAYKSTGFIGFTGGNEIVPTSNPVIAALRQWKTFSHRGKVYPISHSTPLAVCDQYFDLITEHGFRDVLEIGTLYGQSTLFLAEAARKHGGHVTTVDLRLSERQWINKEPITDIHEVAERLISEAGLSDVVEFIAGNSNDVLPALAKTGKKFDFILIDGSHDYPVALLDFINADRLVKPGGIIAMDDVGAGTARRENFNGGPNRILPMIFSSGRYEIEMLNANIALCHRQA